MRLVSTNCLDMEYLLLRQYEADFVTPSCCAGVFADKDTFDNIVELFLKYAGFEPTFAPNVVISTQGMLQKVLPLSGYMKDGVLFVMWGGYSHKDHWFEVPKDEFYPWVVDNIKVAVIGEFAVKVVDEPGDSGKEFTKANKLSTLEVGSFKIDSVKSVPTTYGDKFIVIIGGQEYWANKQLSEYIDMIRDTEKLSGMTLNVLSKGVTATGHHTVKVGLSR